MEEPKGGTGFPPRKWPALLGNDFGDNDGLKEGFYILARAGIGWGYPYSFKSWSRSRVYWDSYLPAHVSSGFSPKSGLKVWYHYHRHLSRIVLPIFSISIRQDNPKKKNYPLKKHLYPFTRPLGTLYFYVLFNFQKTHPIFPSKKILLAVLCVSIRCAPLRFPAPTQRFNFWPQPSSKRQLPGEGFKKSANKNSTKTNPTKHAWLINGGC